MILFIGADILIKARIEQPCTIACPLDIPRLQHIAWYRCTTGEECRNDWDKNRIAHIQDMKDVIVDYPGRFEVLLNGTLTIKEVQADDDGKLYLCKGEIQFSGTVQNTTIVEIIKGIKLQNC